MILIPVEDKNATGEYFLHGTLSEFGEFYNYCNLIGAQIYQLNYGWLIYPWKDNPSNLDSILKDGLYLYSKNSASNDHGTDEVEVAKQFLKIYNNE